MLGRLALLVLVLSCLLGWEFDRRFHFPSKSPDELLESYDFIVGVFEAAHLLEVGAGSAGATLASRLSEDERHSVLLLEAGGDGRSTPWSHIPGLVPFNQRGPIDWEFLTEPEERANLGIKDRRALWPRGKVLGGTSVLNYMLHVRGRPTDYDRWATEFGLKGWSWADVEPFYRKLENFQDDRPGRGKNGPIKAGFQHSLKSLEPFRSAWWRAVKEVGLPTTADYNNAATHEGFGDLQTSIFEGKRQSTAQTYLARAKHRASVHAKGEVILSAGAVGSPHILLLSGIGPRDQLDSLRIPVVHESPEVGKNLQDHVMTPIIFTFNSSVGADWYPQNTMSGIFGLLKNLFDYSVGQGLLTGVPITHQALVHSGVPGAPTKSPDIQFYVAPTYLFGDIGERNVGYTPEVEAAETANAATPYMLTVMSGLQQPRSRGSVSLASPDFHRQPRMHSNLLSHPRDSLVIVKGLEVLREVIGSRALAHLGPKTAEAPVPGCQHLHIDSRDYLECLVMHKGITIYHPTSTCRMGNDPNTSVVDSRLRVGGLRVADASVFPDIVSGNTNLPSILVGEMAAHFLTHSD